MQVREEDMGGEFRVGLLNHATSVSYTHLELIKDILNERNQTTVDSKRRNLP